MKQRDTKVLESFDSHAKTFYRKKLTEWQLHVWIIHPDELALTPENYLLLPLARGKKLAEFIEICLLDGLTDYLESILDVGMLNDPNAIWHKLWE